MLQNASVFNILTCKFAWRHSRVLFSTILTHPNVKKWSVPLSFLTFWLANVLLATAACNFSTSELQKVVRSWGVLHILTCKCASRYSGVQFCDIRTSKSGPKLRCFAHFDLQMCFSLQRRAIFGHLNFQKCFSLQRRAIFLFALSSYLRTRCFSEPTFRPSRHTNHRKTQRFATFLTFRACGSSFF